MPDHVYPDESLICIARVVSVHPLKREMHLTAEPAYAGVFSGLESVFIQAPQDAVPRKHIVVKWRGSEEAPIACLGAGTPQDILETFRNQDILYPDDSLPETSNPVTDVNAMQGFEVADSSGEILGTVVRSYATAMNAALRVEECTGKYFAFPIIDEVLLEIDADKRRIVVDDLTPYKVYDED